MSNVAIGLSSSLLGLLYSATASAQPAPAPTPAPAPDVAVAPTAPPPVPSVAATTTESDRFARNAIYGELGGAGGFYSLNYERFLRKDASIRGGVMYLSMSATATGGGGTSSASATWISIPLMF